VHRQTHKNKQKMNLYNEQKSRDYWFQYGSNRGFYDEIYFYYVLQEDTDRSWALLTIAERIMCCQGEKACEDVYKIYRIKLNLYILCSAFTCTRISHRSKFKKFPIDLTRKLKDFLI